MNGDRDCRPDDPLLDAAAAASDGRMGDVPGTLDEDGRRVYANLARLARLRGAFAQYVDESGPGSPEEWGHLRVLERIGEGSFGVVHRAFDPVLQREVALKLRRKDGIDASACIGEARRLARVRHPNVLAVYGADVHDGRVGIWSDLLEGETIAHRIERGGSLARDTIFAVARQLVAALAAIHEAGLVHGDVKAGNVMLSGERAVLMDFGAGGEIGSRPRYGSPATMAPELLQGAPATPASDMYSLGALLARLAGGRGGAQDGHEAAMPIGRTLRSALGAPLAGLVARMRSADAQARPNARAAEAGLRRIAERPLRRRRRLAVVAVVASLALALVASLAALQHVRAARARSEAMTDFLVGSVGSVRPEKLKGPASLAALFDTMAGNADTRLGAYPSALARMRLVIGKGVSELGDPVRGLDIAERGVALLESTDPGAVAERANAWSLIAILRKHNQDPVGSEAAARASIALYQSLPASRERDVNVVKVRTVLGNVLTQTGRWREAVAAHRKILHDRAVLLGADAPELAVDYNNLAAALMRMDRYEEARNAYREADRRLAGASAGASAVHRLFVREGLALCELGFGHLERARAMLEEVRAAYLREYPDDHRYVVRTEVMLADLERRAGHETKALETLRALAPEAFSDTTGRLVLIRALLANGRFGEAAQDALLLKDDLDRAGDPRSAYVPALIAYARRRAGEDGDDPIAAIDRASASLRDAGYGDLEEIAELADWRARLQ